MQIMRPDRIAVVNHSNILKGNKAQQFQFVGKRLSEDKWPEGTYTAFYKVLRGEAGEKQKIIDETFTIDVVDVKR